MRLGIRNQYRLERAALWWNEQARPKAGFNER
jgi:hypothetical protein